MAKPVAVIKETDIQYRILYDSLSRFSIYLNKADSLSAIQECLQQNIKYLYTYSLCRFHFFDNNSFVSYTAGMPAAGVSEERKPCFLASEQRVYESGIPYHAIGDGNEDRETWIWKFAYNTNAGMLVYLQSGGSQLFSKQQIPVLKTVSEMLYTKTRMVLLLHDSRQKQEELSRSYSELEHKNRIISELMSSQEKIIAARTKALSLANAKLVDMIQYHSHHIREPIARVLGLLQLKAIMPVEEYLAECWPLLQQSVQDMDNTIKQIVYKTETLVHHETISD